MDFEKNAEKGSDRDQRSTISPELSSDDVAASFGINEKSLLRKLDLHLLPGVGILYLLSFLDRSNVANAKLDGLTTDLHFTGDQYLTGLTVFFIGYISFEVVWNIMLKRIGPKIWLPTITLIWGVVATLQGVIVYHGGNSGLSGFYAVRFFLGFTEGGLFPGVVSMLLVGKCSFDSHTSTGLLSVNVVQEAGEAVPHRVVLQRRFACRRVRRHPRLRHRLYEGCRWSERMEMDVS